jgi:hydroxymethylpyrimidine/phosphomethylpyrimidine kinase
MTHSASSRELPVALSIAGSDSGAGAGIQADLLTFASQGVFGTTAITCLTAQNPRGVSGIQASPAAFVVEQCAQVAAHFHPKALKTGMLLNAEIVLAVAGFIKSSGIPAVVDPVMVASSGATLLAPDAIAAVRTRLIPLAALVTPNLDEAISSSDVNHWVAPMRRSNSPRPTVCPSCSRAAMPRATT